MNDVELDVSGFADGTKQHVAEGAVCAGLVEGGTYTIKHRYPTARLFVDDVPLPRDGDACTWEPGFYAGRVKAELVAENGRSVGCWWLDVGPATDKLGTELFRSMVDGLLRYKPELLLGTAARQDVFSEAASRAPLEVQYVRLVSRASACRAALRRVCEQPMTRLTRDRQRLPLHRVQRVDRRSVRSLILAHALPALHALELAQCAPGRVDVPVARITHDHAANRAMAWMVRRLAHRVASLMGWLRGAAAHDKNLAPKCERRLQILGMLRRQLQHLLGQPPFSEVTRAAVSSAGLTAISAHPVYARAFRLMWRALQDGVGTDASGDALAIGPTWQVYERWCYMHVVDTVRALFPQANWREQTHGSQIDQFRTTAMHGQYRLSVTMQRRFRAWDQSEGAACRSLSRERIPDIILTVTGPHGSAFMVLDAKYRVRRANVLEAMQSAHIYRDSLRYREQRPWRSLLLVPDSTAVSWLADPAFQDRHAVGAIVLRERDRTHALRNTLEMFFMQACRG